MEGRLSRDFKFGHVARLVLVAVLVGVAPSCASSTTPDPPVDSEALKYSAPDVAPNDGGGQGGDSAGTDAVVILPKPDVVRLKDYGRVAPAATLREAAAAAGISVGVAIWAKGLFEQPGRTELVASEFDRIYTAGNAHGFTQGFHPNKSEWRWIRNDNAAQFALESDVTYHAVQVVYDVEVGWLADFTSAEVADAMEAHIQQVVTHYQNEFADLPILFNVVNEAISASEAQDYSPWLWYTSLGESYIASAFNTARAYAPEAQLYYNDNGNGSWEDWGAKWDRIQSLVQGLVDADVPVDGVGFQLHQKQGKWPPKEEIVARFKAFEEMGLEVMVTELFVATDESFGADEAARTAAQNLIFVDVVEACLEVAACKGVTFFGLTGEEWEHKGSTDPVSLFNADLSPRPAYQAVLAALKAYAR